MYRGKDRDRNTEIVNDVSELLWEMAKFLNHTHEQVSISRIISTLQLFITCLLATPPIVNIDATMNTTRFIKPGTIPEANLRFVQYW